MNQPYAQLPAHVRPSPAHSRRPLLSILLALASAACGGGGGSSAGGGGLAVVLTPADVTLDAGGRITFQVRIAGTSDQRVRFELSAGPGTLAADGSYTAPATVAVSGTTATVRATSLADASRTGTATVRLRAQGGGNMGPLEALAARVGTTGAVELTDLLQRGTSNAVEAAVTAARLTGQPQPVRFGTLRQQPGGAVAYEPVPTDRLVVIPLAADTTTFRILTMNGDFSNAPGSFFDSDHDLDIRVDATGLVDLQQTSQRRFRSIQRGLRGTRVIDGNNLTVDLTEAEQIVFQSSGGGVEFRSTNAVRGSIEGQGIRVTVQDDLAHHYIFTTRASSTRQRTLASTWQVNGVNFELRDGSLWVTFLDGRGVEVDTYWRATGTVRRNGVQVGTIQAAVENNFYVVRLVGGAQPIELTRIFLGA